MLLDDLKKNNEFPILFIGSGISKRFLKDYPDWVNLLKYFWNQIDDRGNFYGEFNKLNDSIHKKNIQYSELEVTQHSLIEMGSIIEEKYNNAFNNGKIEIPNFSTEDAFRKKVSPFKQAVAFKFKDYNINPTKLKEYNEFKNMIAKSQIILTTNYDTFIEDSYNAISKYAIKTYVGQRGFFENTNGMSELYKIHGSIDYSRDIVITEEDYKNFISNSILISAKITSMMMHSPIIFMGYSLSDLNIRRIIKNITKSVSSEELYLFEQRLIIIDWKEGVKELIQEKSNDRDLGCQVNIIKTDNYEEIFKAIGSINQGLSPSEVQRYFSVFRKLIIDKGKEGALDTVLISPEGIDSLNENLVKKNIVVAIGGPEYIFQIPDIFTYCIDYISDRDEINNEIRLRFISLQNSNSRIPVCKVLKERLIDSSNLHDKEKSKLKGMIDKKTNFGKIHETVKNDYFNPDKMDVNAIVNKFKIYSDKNKRKIYNTISYYIKNLDLEEIKKFLLNELNYLNNSNADNISSQLRKLMLLYDILKNKK